MFRRFKSLAAKLALFALISVQLHVLQHVFGADHDDGPCPICQTVLAQRTLEAVAPVLPPEAPLVFRVPLPDAFVPFVSTVAFIFEPRGPPLARPA